MLQPSNSTTSSPLEASVPQRLACVDVPALPLQLLMQRHEGWRGQPVAVVDRDAAHGTVQCVNERALRAGVLPGASFSSALALCSGLCAAEVHESEIARAVQALVDLLRRFSPNVEPHSDEPGVCWVDVAGLERLHPSRIAWARRVRAELLGARFESAVVLGWQRFSTYAVAKSLHGARVIVFDEPAKESAFANSVLLRRIGIHPQSRNELEKLGLRTLGDFLRLPVESVHVRFGEELSRLHRLASGQLHVPLAPALPQERIEASIDLDDPVSDIGQLTQIVTELVQPLLARVASADRAVERLALRLVLEDQREVQTQVEVIEPTLDLAHWLRLLKLRLEQIKLARGVERVEVELHSAPANAEQLRLFGRERRGHPKAVARCFEALRAAFGDDVLMRARLVPAHLPEASFRWERIDEGNASPPHEAASPEIVRRVHSKPIPIAAPARHRDEGWMPCGPKRGVVERLDGPYLISGGWWGTPVEREYYFAHLSKGARLRIYFDRLRRRWFRQGTFS